MKKAIVTLSFDDGRIDNYRVAKEILLPNNIPATINIATGYIDGSLKILGGGGITLNRCRLRIFENCIIQS